MISKACFATQEDIQDNTFDADIKTAVSAINEDAIVPEKISDLLSPEKNYQSDEIIAGVEQKTNDLDYLIKNCNQ